MKAINIPGFTAETSLYATHGYYRTVGAERFVSDGNAAVIPQGNCPAWKWFGCVAAVGACTAGCIVASTGLGFAVCLGLCLGAAGSIGCVSCAGLSSEDEVTATQAALSMSGGGGGSSSSGGGRPSGHCDCPRGTRCCGGCTKVPGQGLVCNDICVGPGEQCP